MSGIGTPAFKKGTVVDIDFLPGNLNPVVRCGGYLRLTENDYHVIIEDSDVNKFLEEINNGD